MSLEFQREEVRPGEETNLTIRAPPESFVGVVAVDKSVYIQQEKNQLTTSKVSVLSWRYPHNYTLDFTSA